MLRMELGCSARVVRRWSATCGLAAVLGLLGLHASAQTYLPSIKIGTASLVSPTTANTYYAHWSDASTDGLGGITGTPTPTPVEIVELNRALKGDTDLIYQYVRNNIQTAWMYGLQKGALGASIDKSGTPFDQAELMVALLRQAGTSAKYVAGTIYFGSGGASIQQFTDWTGISSARGACQLLANGGIPATVNGVGDAACSTINANAALSSVRMAHIWVQVTMSGCAPAAYCVFDPSYKAYTWKTGIGPAAAMGLTPGQPLTDATTGGGYAQGTTGDPLHLVSYVKSLNAETLTGDMQTYATTLLGYIQTNHLQGAQMEDIIGGGVLIPSNAAVRQGALPYADPSLPLPYQPHVWTPGVDAARYNAIPDHYRTTLEVKGNTSQFDTGSMVDTHPFVMFDPTLYSDEIYGRRLTVETSFYLGGISNEGDYYDQGACLALDAVAWGAWSNAVCLEKYDYDPGGVPPSGKPMARLLPVSFDLTVDHPYAAAAAGGAAGSYMDETLTKGTLLVTPLTIVHGWGDVSPALLAKWSEERDSDTTLPILNTFTRCQGSAGGDGNLCVGLPQPTGNFEREKLAAGWLAQFSRAARINAQLANAVPQIHHALGLVAAANGLQPVITDPAHPTVGFVLPDNTDFIDVDAGVSFSSRTSDTASVPKRRGAIRSFAAAAEMLEGSIMGQQEDLPDTASTATRFEWGNRPPVDALQNPFAIPSQEFYAFNGGNAYQAFQDATHHLVQTDGAISGSCVGTTPQSWSSQPVFTPQDCTTMQTNLGAQIAAFAGAGFDVYASKETFLGPGQRGGAIVPDLNSFGLPSQYSHALGNQRGGAFVAIKSDGDEPLEIAHIIMSGASTAKGGGGGTQPDTKTAYDPGTAADILKSRFVDRSNALGVNLSNGSLGMTSPVSIDIGNGGFPYQLSASLSWHPGTPPAHFGPVSPIAPLPGWSHSWKNALTVSGSGLEAMGASDIRAAVGAIVAFAVAQDIYQSSETAQREVAGVLTQSWWAHQLSGNVATVNIGGNTRQFVRIADGSWIAPGAGYATLVQHGTRNPYEEKCFHQFFHPPYGMSRGWDSSGVSFTVTNAPGDVENFAYFENDYHSVSADLPSDLCGRLKGFRLTSWTFPQGVTVTPTYTPVTIGEDSFDTLSSVANNIGRSLSFTDTRITAGARHIDMSDNTANPLSMTDALSHATSFTYRPPVTAPTTTQRQLPYPLLDSITTPEHPSQPNTEYDYDGVNQISTVTDAVAIQQGGRNPYQFFIADGTRGERDDPLGQPYTVVYDTYGHASRYLDELGAETDALFDSRGRAVSYTYPEGDCEVFGYDNRNNTTNFWKVDKTSSCNTSAGSSHVLHVSATWDTSWNKPHIVTDARGNVTELDYFPAGSSTGTSLVQTATLPQIDIGGVPTSPVYTFTYDAAGKLVDRTTPTTTGQPGIVIHNEYQTNEDPKATTVDYSTGTGHLNLKTQLLYDADGNLTAVTDPRMNVTTSIWDADRRKTEDDHHDGNATMALNAASKTLYDAIGRVTDDQVGTAFSGTTVTTWLTTKHTTYTPTSKVATVTDADNRTTTTVYDDGDRTLTITDPISRKIHFTYCTINDLPNCAANQVDKEVRAWSTGNACSVSGTLQECYRRLTYGGDGEELTIRDANGNTTAYSYDGWNRLNDTAFPDTTHEHLVMDENGNVTTRTTRAGDSLGYIYNALNLITQKTMPVPPTSSLTTTWKYRLDGNVDVITDTAGYKIDYGYDTAGRMNQVANRIDGFGADRTVNYQLDANGNRTQLQWPTQDAAYAVSYCYDSLNRMTQAAESLTDCVTNPLAAYSYDAQSRRTNITYGNGTQVQTPSPAAYSLAGDLLSLKHELTGSTNDNTFTYAYTSAHQTQTAAASNSNWLWQPPASNSTSYTVNSLNQYPTIGTQTTGGTNCQGAAQGLSYDCNGNLTFDGNFTYTYDAENRLLKATNTSVNARYEYDPLGRRTKKSGTGVTPTFFLNDGSDEIAEYNSSNAVTTRYIPGPAIDEPIAVETVSTGAKEYFHTDKQGSVVAMSDGSGNLIEGPYTYDPYGNCFVSLTACSITGEPYRFTGQRYDAETGCYYYRARYYCPDDDRGGRFLQADLVGYVADMNLYTYVGNDPSNRSDPYGLLQLYVSYGANAGYVLGGEGSGGYALDVDALLQNRTLSIYKFYAGGVAGGIGQGEGAFGGASAGAGLFVGSKSDFHGWFISATGSGKVLGYGVNLVLGFPPNHFLDMKYANISIGGGPGLMSLTSSATYTWFDDEKNLDVSSYVSSLIAVADSAQKVLSHLSGLHFSSDEIQDTQKKLKQARSLLYQIKEAEQEQAQISQCNNTPGCHAGSAAGAWGNGGPQ